MRSSSLIRRYRRTRPGKLTHDVHNENQVLGAGAVLVSGLGQSAGVILALTALAYFMGWRYCVGYFTTLGIPWLIPSLSPLQYLIYGGGLLLIAVSVGLCSVLYVSTTTRGARHVLIGALILTVLALAFTFSKVAVRFDLVSESEAVQLNLGAYFLLIFASGLSIGEVCQDIAKDGSRVTAGSLSILLSALIWACGVGPSQIGSAVATTRLLQPAGFYPTVELNQNNSKERWLLIGIAGGSAVLMSKCQSCQNGRWFRLVELKEINRIAAVEANIPR